MERVRVEYNLSQFCNSGKRIDPQRLRLVDCSLKEFLWYPPLGNVVMKAKAESTPSIVGAQAILLVGLDREVKVVENQMIKDSRQRLASVVSVHLIIDARIPFISS